MNILLELGVVGMVGLANSPWPKQDYQLFHQKTEFRFENNSYIDIVNSSRVSAVALDNMNPQTAAWQVGAGYRFSVGGGILDAQIGHKSEHETGEKDRLTESYHYINLKWSTELEVNAAGR